MEKINDSDGNDEDVFRLISSFLGPTPTMGEAETETDKDLEEVKVKGTVEKKEKVLMPTKTKRKTKATSTLTPTSATATATVTLGSDDDNDDTRHGRQRQYLHPHKPKCSHTRMSPVPLITMSIDRVIIFSKDRPWQLQQLLRSMDLPSYTHKKNNDMQNDIQNSVSNTNNRCGTNLGEKFFRTHQCLQIHIIVHVTDLFREGYERVKKEYNGMIEDINNISIVWMNESIHGDGEDGYENGHGHGHDKDKSFTRLLEEAVGLASHSDLPANPISGDKEGNHDHDPSALVMFLTDDCILLEPLAGIFSTCRDLFIRHCCGDVEENYVDDGTDTCTIHMNENKNHEHGNDGVFGFLTRLHPGITYCQTRDRPSPPPPRSHLVYQQASIDSGLDAFVYPRDIAAALSSGSCEFNYPFDLSGGVYPQVTVMKLLTTMKERQGRRHYSHPNKLEIHANNLLQKSQTLKDHMSKNNLLGIPSRPALLILAINRVQDVCKAPIAVESEYGEEHTIINEKHTSVASSYGYTPKFLMEYLYQEKRLDLNKYKSRMFHTSHIGSVFLENDCSDCTTHAEIEAKTSARANVHHHLTSDDDSLSVLIPIHCGPPSAASLALKSILHQAIIEDHNDPDNISISKMQVVLVDDRCSDGSIDAMLATARMFAQECHTNGVLLVVAIRDHRNHPSSSCPIMDVPNEEGIKVSINIDVISSPSSGVGAALNHGLQRCKYELVARMDADDISCPGRLVSQMRYLRHHPNVNVLGTHCIIFSDVPSSKLSKGDLDDGSNDSDRNSKSLTKTTCMSRSSIVLPYSDGDADALHDVIRCSVEPTDAGFVAWCMLFSCVVVHPSVMMRRSSILSLGGYCEDKTGIRTRNDEENETEHGHEHEVQHECVSSFSVSVTEDYDLWLRSCHQNIRSVCSMPRVGIYHRKHVSRSSNDTRARRQRKESIHLSFRAMLDYIKGEEGQHSHSATNICSQDLHQHRHHFQHLSLEIVEVLKYPDSATFTCIEVLDRASDLLCQLEKAFLRENEQSLTKNEMKLIQLDCNERVGELATLAVQRFGRAGTQGSAWEIWCRRCPYRQLERIALLCHAGIH